MSVAQKGTIRTDVENIFPIIKKFLYSDHEIFLRELVSNGVDACQKIKTLSSKGEAQGELGELTVRVTVDKEAKTLTISDNGLGMTKEEVDKYINQIAFSSAKEFLEKYQDEASIIGHFGLGFYSGFMVADKIEIQTLSFKEAAESVSWSCDGTPNYEMDAGTRTERGTDIILHISDDSLEFLEDYRVRELLNKYCKFLPVNIQFQGANKVDKEGAEGEDKEQVLVDLVNINNTNPAWTQKPADLTDEDYKNFYKELYPYSYDEPLFWIHLNVDYPFNLTGILYFPKLKQNMEVRKDKISLYSNQVFVTDNVEEIVPEFLTLLQGVLDSPDIPLNVSRSYLQSDPNVKRISNHITKKVAAKLEEIFKNDRAEFEAKWQDINIFIKYGILSNEKFAEKAKSFVLVENLEGKFSTLEEYENLVSGIQTDKNDKLVMLYTSDAENQDSYIRAAQDRGYDVLKMEHPYIDPHFVGHLEQSEERYTFKRVDAATIDQLIETDEAVESVLNEEQETSIKDLFSAQVVEEGANIQMKAMSPNDLPITIVKPELMRRMKEMSASSGMPGMGAMPEMFDFIVNTNHPVISKLLDETDGTKKADVAKQLTDLALLSQGMLKGSKLTDFIKRSVDLV